MSDAGKPRGMKSAYELALERMEAQGIERPREEALSEAVKLAIAEARRVTEARLAELDILHRDQLHGLTDPAQREELEEQYRRDRKRAADDGEARVATLRAAKSG